MKNKIFSFAEDDVEFMIITYNYPELFLYNCNLTYLIVIL